MHRFELAVRETTKISAMPPLLQLGHRQQLVRSFLTGMLITSKYSSATFVRWASSKARWKQRQSRDAYARDAKVQGLKSRAAFKLLEVTDLPLPLKLGMLIYSRWMPNIGSSKEGRPSSTWQVYRTLALDTDILMEFRFLGLCTGKLVSGMISHHDPDCLLLRWCSLKRFRWLWSAQSPMVV